MRDAQYLVHRRGPEHDLRVGFIVRHGHQHEMERAKITKYLIHCGLLVVRNTTATPQPKIPTMAHPMDDQHSKFLLLVAECNGHGRCNNFALSLLESVNCCSECPRNRSLCVPAWYATRASDFLLLPGAFAVRKVAKFVSSRHMCVSIATSKCRRDPTFFCRRTVPRLIEELGGAVFCGSRQIYSTDINVVRCGTSSP